MRFALSLILLVGALSAFAGELVVEPKSLSTDSVEVFIRIYSDKPGTYVLYSGKAGKIELEVNAQDERGVTVWVPAEVLLTPDRYQLGLYDANHVLLGVGILEIFDGQRPFVLLVPDPVVVPAASSAGAHVGWEVWPHGGSGSASVSCSPSSGSLFPLGPSVAHCTATNSGGETASGDVTIFVADLGMPIVYVPDDIRVEAKDYLGIPVSFEVRAKDDIDGELPVTCSRKSESLFPIGKTEVLCVALDRGGNVGSGVFNVEVIDPKENSKITLELPEEVNEEAMNAEGAYVKFEASAKDPDGNPLDVKCSLESGALFPFGDTLVTCYAEDKDGGRKVGSFDVHVIDTIAPHVERVAAEPNVLDWTDKLVPVRVDVLAFDLVDPQPRCSIVDVFSSQPEDDGEEDWVVMPPLDLELRAQRWKSDLRTYSILVECKDASENATLGSVDVVVK